MSGQEVLALLYMAKRLFPREKALDVPGTELKEIAKAWAEMLWDIPFEVGKAALSAHAAGSPYAPAISEIRAYARKLTQPPALSADEAWALAIRAVQRYGMGQKNFTTGKYPHEMARESVPPEVWRVMDLLGYRDMCLSTNTDVLRGQFIRAWERQQELRRERENILPCLPEGMRDRFLAIGTASGS